MYIITQILWDLYYIFYSVLFALCVKAFFFFKQVFLNNFNLVALLRFL